MTDIGLIRPADGLALSRDIRQRWPQTSVVVVTGRHPESALAVPQGAVFVAKPNERRLLLAFCTG
ncbi:hypothetical protein L2Y96_12635 [Luteibacter aegosomaticola]|uniref:hypothetical protein n=1 Tax=Luteibacter aegosomaticola TaxID=2911538 RepID=UPI001FFBA23D|nr:hypothetical protein [Luteibacter aegosomaticola]UPG88266.1 hypothetical protein L2Y96_12635 [Luteibacter aegosomaticola]